VVPRAGPAPARAPSPEPVPAEPPADAQHTALARFVSFADVLALIAAARDLVLLTELETHVRLVRYRPGLIEFNPAPDAPGDLAGRLGQRLRGLTGARWSVLVSDAQGRPSVADERRHAEAAARTEAENHPLVAAALATFPGARIGAVRPLGPAGAAQDGILAPAPEPDEMDSDLADGYVDSYVDADDPFEEDS
jgi:DNA polymerase-3 subunit gamma/tau